jgi:hypothetical protein
VVTVEEVRSFASTLPRTTEAIVGGELKLRAGRVASEMRELVLDAWALVVPKRIAEAYAENGASGEEETR